MSIEFVWLLKVGVQLLACFISALTLISSSSPVIVSPVNNTLSECKLWLRFYDTLFKTQLKLTDTNIYTGHVIQFLEDRKTAKIT